MPSKEDLEHNVKELEKNIKELKHNNEFLLRQQKELKRLAEQAGGEVARWKHDAIRIQEELRKVKK